MIPPLCAPNVPGGLAPPPAGATGGLFAAPESEKPPEEEQTVRVIVRKHGERVLDKHIKPSQVVARIREELHHIPSRPVILFLNGRQLKDNYVVDRGQQRIEYDCEIYDVMTAEDRKNHLFRLVEAWKKGGEFAIGDCFQRCSEGYKDDKDFVKNAMKVWPGLFRYVSERLKGEWELALPGVLHDPAWMKDLPERLRSNKNFVLQVMQKHFMCVRDATTDLKNDKGFIKDAIRVHPHAFFAASAALKDDAAYVRECMEVSSEPKSVLRYASKAAKEAIANLDKPQFSKQSEEEEPDLKRGRLLTPAEILAERMRNGGTYS